MPARNERIGRQTSGVSAESDTVLVRVCFASRSASEVGFASPQNANGKDSYRRVSLRQVVEKAL